jgi:ABC-type transport system involved in multi-copper enzyme maturation permease subunit
MRWLLRRELALVFGARATWLVAAVAAVLVGHGFALALDLYTSASRTVADQALMLRELDPLAGIVRPTLGGLELAVALLLPVIAVRGVAIEKERGSYGALVLRAGSAERVIAAKLLAALAGAALLLVAPIVLCIAFAIAGGHLDAIETAIALGGHVLHAAVITCIAVAAAAACRTVAQATVVALAVSLASWAIDANEGFAALAWLGALEWASIGRKLAPFEQGIVHIGAIVSLLALTAGAAAIAFVLGRIEFGMRRRLQAAAVAVAAVLVVWLFGAVHRAYDWSEQRRESLPPSVVSALRDIPDQIELDVWLDRDDGRRWQLERDALAKLVLARPDTEIRMPLDGAADRIAEHDADYGRIVIRAGGVRETRSASRKELVTLVLEAASAPRPDWTYPDYPGYPFVADGATRTLLVALAYLIVPAVLALVGLVLTRSRRST